MNRRHRLAPFAVLLAVAAATVAAPRPALAAAAPSCVRPFGDLGTDPARDQSATARPVVFVHGWTGGPMTESASLLSATLPGKITTFTFDYSKWGADWPTNANIAPCLADYVNRVSADYQSAGGDGKVVLVAHSMGGLAIRYASSAQYVPHPITARTAPLVITLDTPYLGSPWGGSFIAGAAQLFGALEGKSVPNPFGTDGGKCLQPHETGSALPDQCGGLPPWLAGGTTLDEIGGAITIRRTLLGIHLYDVPTGSDGIVHTQSSVGYLTSGPGGHAPVVSSPTSGTTVHAQYVDCSVDTGQISRAENALGGTLASVSQLFGITELGDWAVLNQIQSGQESPAVWLYSAAALPAAGCSHVHIYTDDRAIAQVADDVGSYVDAHRNGSGAPASSAQLIAFIAAGRRVDASEFEFQGRAQFSTPSGNLHCTMTHDGYGAPDNDFVECKIDQYSFPRAATDSCIGGPFDANLLSVGEDGTSLGVCDDESQINGNAPELAYGNTVTLGNVACRSDAAFLACADTAKHWGWIVSRSTFRTYSPGSCPDTLTLLKAARAKSTLIANVNWVQCSGDWAATEQQGGGNAYTGVYHRVGPGWVAVDRDEPCRRHEIPAAIYEAACDSN